MHMHALVAAGQRIPFERDLIDCDTEAERDDSQIMSAQSRRRDAKQHACESRKRASAEHPDQQIDPEALVENRRGVRADRYESTVTQRDLTAAAHEQVEADRDDRKDEEFGYDEQPINLTLADELEHNREQGGDDDDGNRNRVSWHVPIPRLFEP